MSPPRNTLGTPAGQAPSGDDGLAIASGRTLSARSVVASTLLGASPPQLPVGTIVRCGELFGIPSGTVRTAVSRMLADGDLEVDRGSDGNRPVYRIGGPLLARHGRQAESRSPDPRPWDGTWTQAVVHAGAARPAGERHALRAAARTLRLAELREGVWLRPDNLDHTRHDEALDVVANQCALFSVSPTGSPAALAAALWNLDGWVEQSHRLIDALDRHAPALASGHPQALATGFLLSAGVLRHLLADPLLPTSLLPEGWPGEDLRSTYDAYDAAYKLRWRDWFREVAASDSGHPTR
jgi:phenylacetic acid degradation operon negative regulatory protein